MSRQNVEANSLLYAIYICLIVSILCAALLYYSSLYNLLNQFYNSREDLYVQNQSSLTYFLNGGNLDETLTDEETGIYSTYETVDYGLLKIATVKSILAKDTVTSTHFVGSFNKEKLSLYLPKFSNPISYSGSVTLIGDKKLPSQYIDEKYINNQPNTLTSNGAIEVSGDYLPEVRASLASFVTARSNALVSLKDIERKNDSIYYNSFLNKTINISLTSTTLQNIVIKGNFILHAKDSITIKKTSILEDVIIMSPIINIESDFEGTIQAIATKKIELNANVALSYPSALVVYSNRNEKSDIIIQEGSTIYGAVVLFGSSIIDIDENKIVAKEKTLIVGDVYSSGKIMSQGKIYGSVYSNRIFSQTKTGVYENCLIDVVIDVSKRPNFFVSIPIFNTKNNDNGIFKKVY